MPAARARPAGLALLGLYAFAVAVNLVGIGWGLPGHGSDLLPPLAQAAVVEEADQAWTTAQDPARNLNFGPPAPERPETVAKILRRFALYTADPDEVVALMAVARLNPVAGRWDPGFAQYGGLFLYALGGTLKLASVLGMVTLRADPSFYVLSPERMARIYLVGRLLVVAVGSLAIPLLWLVAYPLYGRRAALWAAGVGACAPAWVAWSHVMKPMAFGAPFALATVAVGQRLTTSPRPWRASLGAGVLSGLAAGSALQYGMFLLGPWVAIVRRRTDGVGRRLCLAAVAGIAATGMVLALHPYWLMAPHRSLAAWGMISGWYPPAYHPSALLAFAWGSLGPALGFTLLVVGALEALILAWRDREALAILVPLLVMLAAAAVKTGAVPGDPLHARLVLPAVLLLAILAAGGLSRMAWPLPTPLRLMPALLVLPSLFISAALLRNFIAAGGPEGTRQRAGAWVNALPQGASIGLIAPLAPFRSPYFRPDRYQLIIESNPGQELALKPEYFLVAERSDLPSSHAFLARYREVGHFAPAALPFEHSAQAVYPFANPPIRIYTRRTNRD